MDMRAGSTAVVASMRLLSHSEQWSGCAGPMQTSVWLMVPDSTVSKTIWSQRVTQFTTPFLQTTCPEWTAFWTSSGTAMMTLTTRTSSHSSSVEVG